MPLLSKKTVLLAKIETTPGTAEALTAAEGAFNIYDAKIEPDIEFITRQGQAAFTPINGVTGARKGRCTFRTDLVGSGTGGAPVPAWASTFLPACRWCGTGSVYMPYSQAPGSTVKTVTIAVQRDGKQWVLRGAAGNAVFKLESGKPASVEFSFEGIYDEPTDAALVVPNFPSVQPPRFAGQAVTFQHGTNAQTVSGITLDLGNEIQLREDPADSSGYGYALATGGLVKGTVAPEQKLQATNNLDAIFTAHTTAAMAFQCNGGAGNTIAFAMPAMQISKITPGDRNGIMTHEIEFQAVRSADAGDDELSITFS